MSRSGYTDDIPDDNDSLLAQGRWIAQVRSASRGKRGQKFFRELLSAMDAMPDKRLIEGDLIDQDGECCAMGVVCKVRGLDVSNVDPDEPEDVGAIIGIAHQLAAEVAYHNDEWGLSDETPEQRWVRMRKWVASNLTITAEQ